MWWVELQAVSRDALTLVVNRLVTDVDRDPPGDQRRMLVGGQVYSWDDLRIDRDRVEGIVLSHLTPLETAIEVPIVGRQPVRIAALAAGDPLPLLPPFHRAYTALQIHDVAIEWGEDGFLDSRAQADDRDGVTIGRTDRTYPAEALRIRYHALELEGRHHFLFLDPARGWDPTRTGTAFVNGIWSEPWAGLPAHEGPRAALATGGPDAFDEALRDPGDRGWSHRARIAIEGPASVLVDSGRLANPERVARLTDIGTGLPGGAAESGRGPRDPLLIDEAPRPSGLWTYRMHRPTDLYIGLLEGEPRPPASPSPSPTVIPDRSPGTTAPWPTRTPDATESQRDGPLGGAVALVALAVAVLWFARRR